MLSKKTQNGLAILLAWCAPFVLLYLVVSDSSFAYTMAYAACIVGPIATAYWWIKR